MKRRSLKAITLSSRDVAPEHVRLFSPTPIGRAAAMWVALIVGDLHPYLSQLRWQIEGALFFLMGCLAVLVCLLAYEVYVRSMLAVKRAGASIAPEVVVIEESPQPTRSTYTPKPTPPSARTLRARRAGRRRLPRMRRMISLIKSPSRPHHCAYECCLVGMGRKPTIAAIHELRCRVAEREKQLFLTNTPVFGIQIRDFVEAEQLTLSAYLSQVMHTQWASIAEIAVMCEVSGWSTFVQTQEGTLRLGVRRPCHIMKLQHSHYTLWKCRRKKRATETHMQGDMRGGMRVSPTLSPGVPSRHHLQHIECHVEHTFPSDIVHIGIMGRPVDGILAFRKRLGDVLGCSWQRIKLLDQLDPVTVLGDESDICQRILVRDAWYETPVTDNTYVEFNLNHNGESFVLKCRRSTTHQQLVYRLSMLLNLPEASIDLRSVHGEPWMFPASIAQTSVIINLQRGGMHFNRRERSRSRSVTPTMPFVPTQRDQSEEEVSPATVGRIMAEHERARYAPERDPHRGPLSLQDPVASLVIPDDPPAAQPPMIPKPVLDGLREVTHIYAATTANTRRVLADVLRIKDLHAPLEAFPPTAVPWEQVTYVRLPDQPRHPYTNFLDLRFGPWETRQEPRFIPILSSGDVEQHAIVPQATPPIEVQRRLGRYSNVNRWILLVILCDQWMGFPMFLPEDVQDRLNEYDEIMEERRARRGGMRVLTSSEGEYASRERGGMKKIDHKATMLRLAQEKVEEHYKEAAGPTTCMLLRAEQRTVTAALNSKSGVQLRQVIDAAYRRVQLPLPGQHVQTPQRDSMSREQACTLVESMQEHMRVSLQVIDNLAQEKADHGEEFKTFAETLRAHNDAQTKTMHALMIEVNALQQRISLWEETILPCIVENLPGMAVPTPATEGEDADMGHVCEHDALPMTRTHERVEGDEQPTQEYPSGSLVMQNLEQTSLRHCCQRIVQEQPRRAVRPFRV